MEKRSISSPNAGFKSFRPPIGITVILLIMTALAASLGVWQTKRAAEKELIEQKNQNAAEIPLEKALVEKARFSRVSIRGHYDPKRHFLLDNQIWHGQGGVYVFTPFYTLSGTVILVNRGWLALSLDRKNLPAVPTPQEELVLTGILNTLPEPGRILGEPDKLGRDHWPQLLTYMKLTDISDSLQQPLESWVIQLSDTEQSGFDGRVWKPVFITSDRHKAYAFQWFALTVTGFVLWLYSGFRKKSGKEI